MVKVPQIKRRSSESGCDGFPPGTTVDLGDGLGERMITDILEEAEAEISAATRIEKYLEQRLPR